MVHRPLGLGNGAMHSPRFMFHIAMNRPESVSPGHKILSILALFVDIIYI